MLHQAQHWFDHHKSASEGWVSVDRSMAAALPLTAPSLLPKSYTIDFEYQHRHNLIVCQLQLAG